MIDVFSRLMDTAIRPSLVALLLDVILVAGFGFVCTARKLRRNGMNDRIIEQLEIVASGMQKLAQFLEAERIKFDIMAYEAKFEMLLRLISEQKERDINTVVVAWPQVLGDTYEELIESLSRIAEAKLELSIVGRFLATGEAE